MLKGIKQTDSTLLPVIQKYGCLFLCFAQASPLIFSGEKGRQALNKIWTEAEKRGYISPDLNRDGDYDDSGEASAVFKATFRLADVQWTTAVSPAEATGDGAVAFPPSGTTPANGTASAIAVDSEHYTFDHWERNGESVGTNKILSAECTPLAEGEASAVYTAVFTEN